MLKTKAAEKGTAKKKKLVAVLAVATALCVGIGGAVAYFSTLTDVNHNHIGLIIGGGGTGVNPNPGPIIPESHWVPGGPGSHLVPGGYARKDPAVKSNVPYDAYVMAKVSVPKVMAKKAGDTDAKAYAAVLLGTAENEDASTEDAKNAKTGTEKEPAINTKDWTFIRKNDTGSSRIDYYFLYGTKDSDGNFTAKVLPKAYKKADGTYENPTTGAIFTRIIEPADFVEISSDSTSTGMKQSDGGTDASDKSTYGSTQTGDVDVQAAFIQVNGNPAPTEDIDANSTSKALYQTLLTGKVYDGVAKTTD